jgi:hypothetical protein
VDGSACPGDHQEHLAQEYQMFDHVQTPVSLAEAADFHNHGLNIRESIFLRSSSGKRSILDFS